MASLSCPACGSPLHAASSTAGLCTACLLKQVLEGNADPDLDVRSDASAGPLSPGDRFGRFAIAGLLGRGGMATVYEAREAPPLERTVALKVLPPEFLHHDSFAERFTHEAKLVAGLEHPGIVPIYASGIDEALGLPWMSMRLMKEGSLAAQLGRGLGLERTTRILRGVAEALDYAHASGVLHRDIKPTNILLDATGRGCLSDFGLARLMERPEGWTVTGTVAGTPHYMSPEQSLGQPIDRRSDIYSLGVVVYEMLTGGTPFHGPSPVAIGMQHVNDPLPVPARHLASDLVFRVLQKALAKKPADRWPSASAFVSALEAASRRAPVPAWRRTVAGVSVVAIATAVGLWMVGRRPDPTLASSVLYVGWNTVPPVATSLPTLSQDTDAAQSEQARTAVVMAGNATSETPVVKPGGSIVENDPPGPGPSDPPQWPDSSTVSTVTISEVGLQPIEAPPIAATLPKRTFEVKPTYPAIARSLQIQGVVLLEGLVQVNGTVTDIRVIKSPHDVLSEPAIRAFQQFRYESGKAPATVQFSFSFELR